MWVVRINQRDVREIQESKAYDEVDPIIKRDPKVFDFVSSEARHIPVTEESYLPTRIPKGRLKDGQLNEPPETPIPAISTVMP